MKLRPLWIDYHAEAVNRITEEGSLAAQSRILIDPTDARCDGCDHNPSTDSDSSLGIGVPQASPSTHVRGSRRELSIDELQDDSEFVFPGSDDEASLAVTTTKRKLAQQPPSAVKHRRIASDDDDIVTRSPTGDEHRPMELCDGQLSNNIRSSFSESYLYSEVPSQPKSPSCIAHALKPDSQETPAGQRHAREGTYPLIAPALLSRLLREFYRNIARKRLSDMPSNYGTFYFGTIRNALASFWRQAPLRMFSPNEWVRRACSPFSGRRRLLFGYLHLFQPSRGGVLERTNRSELDLDWIDRLCHGRFSSILSIAPATSQKTPEKSFTLAVSRPSPTLVPVCMALVKSTFPPFLSSASRQAGDAPNPTPCIEEVSHAQADCPVQAKNELDDRNRKTSEEETIPYHTGRHGQIEATFVGTSNRDRDKTDGNLLSGCVTTEETERMDDREAIIDCFFLSDPAKRSHIDGSERGTEPPSKKAQIEAPNRSLSLPATSPKHDRAKSASAEPRTGDLRTSLPIIDAVQALSIQSRHDRVATATGGSRPASTGRLPKGSKVSGTIGNHATIQAAGDMPKLIVDVPSSPQPDQDLRRKSKRRSDKKMKRKKERKLKRRKTSSAATKEVGLQETSFGTNESSSKTNVFVPDSPTGPGAKHEQLVVFPTHRDCKIDKGGANDSEFGASVSDAHETTQVSDDVPVVTPHTLENPHGTSSNAHPDEACFDNHVRPHIHPEHQDQLLPPSAGLCSESFIETWGQVTTELATGQWVSPINSEQSESCVQSRSTGRKIRLIDTSLLDHIGVDIELPGRAAVLVCPSDVLETSADSRAFTVRLLQLMAGERYTQIHVIFHIGSNDMGKSLWVAISRLQMTVVQQNGSPICSPRFHVVSISSFSATIAQLVVQSSNSQNSRIPAIADESLVRDSRTEERAQFLVSLLPSLSILGAFQCLQVSSCLAENCDHIDESAVSMSLVLETGNSTNWSLLQDILTALSEVRRENLCQLTVALDATLFTPGYSQWD